MCRCAHRPPHQWSSAEEVQRDWAEHLQEGVDIFQRWLATLQRGESNGPMSEWLVSVADVFKVLHHEEVQLISSASPTEPLSVLLHFQSAYKRAEFLEFSPSRVPPQASQEWKHGFLLRYVESWRTLIIDVVEAYRTPADRRAKLHFYHGMYEPRWPPSVFEDPTPQGITAEASVEGRLLLASEGVGVVEWRSISMRPCWERMWAELTIHCWIGWAKSPRRCVVSTHMQFRSWRMVATRPRTRLQCC